jgi:branched-chain amino acid transport system substrate-binding protein
MRGRGMWTVVAVAMVALVLLSACAPAATPTPQVIVKKETQVVKETVVQQVTAAPEPVQLPDTIIIGSLEPLTGGLAMFAGGALTAQKLAIQHINDAGGIKSLGGLKLELVSEDTTQDLDAARLAAESLISRHKPVAAVGMFMSRLTLGGSEVTEREKVILISDALVDTLMTRGFRYLLRAAPSSGQHGVTGVEFAMEAAEKFGVTVETVAILNEDSAFGRSVALGAAEEALKRMIPIVYQREYPYDISDVSSIVAGIQAADPDVVLHAAYFGDAILFAKTFEETGYKPKFILGLGGTGYTDPDSVEALGEVANYYANSYSYNPNKNTPQNNKFVQEFVAETGAIPTEGGGISYYSMWVLAEMFELSGQLFPDDPLNPDNLREAAQQLDLTSGPAVETVSTNHIDFDGTGQNIHARATILQVLDGELKVIWPFDEAEAEAAFPRPDATQ